MSSFQKNLVVALLCVVAAATGIGGALLWNRSRQTVQMSTGTALVPRRDLPDFSLIDSHGQTFGRGDLRGQWSLMFFGYTNCPDFCPATLATLAAMEKKLRAERAPVIPRVVFVSVDARRDTPDQLSRYVPYFDASFIGLTAKDQPSIEAFARKLGVAVAIHPEADGTYSVDHSGVIFVLDPAGRLAAWLTGPFTTDAVAKDIERLAAGRV
jgi:protein SCO1/2